MIGLGDPVCELKLFGKKHGIRLHSFDYALNISGGLSVISQFDHKALYGLIAPSKGYEYTLPGYDLHTVGY